MPSLVPVEVLRQVPENSETGLIADLTKHLYASSLAFVNQLGIVERSQRSRWTVAPEGSDAVCDALEQAVQLATERGDSDDDDDGDEADHQSVLHRSGATLVPDLGELVLELDELTKHCVPLPGFGVVIGVESRDAPNGGWQSPPLTSPIPAQVDIKEPTSHRPNGR